MPSRLISLPSSLTRELQDIRQRVSIPETEESWSQIEQGIVQLTECCNIGGCNFPEEIIAGIRSMSRHLNHAMKSERSRLSGSAIECVTAQSARLGPLFEPLIPLFMPTLLGICARSNKVFTRRAKACIFAIITHTSSPSILSFLAKSLDRKSTSLRLVAAEGVLTYVKSSNTPMIANDSRARLVENIIRVTAEDASADIRTAGKALFEAYRARLPDCVASFIASLNPVIRKRLVTAASGSTSEVLSSGHPATGRARPVVSIQPQKSSSGKHTEREAHPLRPIALSKQMTYTRQGTAVPVLSSTQSGNRRKDAILPLVPTIQARVGNAPVNTKTNAIPAVAATVRPSSRKGPLPVAIAEHPATRATSSRIPQLRSRRPSTEVEAKTSLQNRKEVVASRSSKETAGRRKPVLGGGSVTKGTKPVVKAPAVRSKMENGKPAPEDKPLPPYHASLRPRRQRDFLTSTPRASLSSPLSPPVIYGAESIPHTHSPNSSKFVCFEGCELRQVLDWSLDDVSIVEAPSVRMKNPNTREPSPEGIPLPPDSTVRPPAVPLVSSLVCTPRRSRQLETVQATHDVRVPRDVNHPSRLCHLRRAPFRPRRQRPFTTSTPRASLSASLSSPDISGAEVIAHTHSPNSNACFEGCELRQVLDWLDMQMDKL
ncbi:hypothetical protein AZE42_03468 [Rhizopogon vesiculosus]|uniref:CLASP N-terminal domain-containing protein n=1 Tax=Rhizopogon vesiculosus TaxID=180088 RepID=A0A1J8R853_9AGAM|nr:hypothetical protein AZE42_03468 [Rhizopogon vesiculosus]